MHPSTSLHRRLHLWWILSPLVDGRPLAPPAACRLQWYLRSCHVALEQRAYAHAPLETMTYAARTSWPLHVYPGCISAAILSSSYSSLGTVCSAM